MAEGADAGKAEQTELRQAVADTVEQHVGATNVESNKVSAINNHQPQQQQQEAGQPKATLQSQFKAFAKFGDTKSDGKHITLSQSDKWMKQAKVIDKTLTTTDTGIHFKKFKSLKISYADYNKYLEDLAKAKNLDVKQMKSKLSDCGPPGVVQVSSAGKAALAVERLTDTSRYTGTHKERFDASGKGKGLAGRKNLVDDTGYVTGYHNKNTYETKH